MSINRLLVSPEDPSRFSQATPQGDSQLFFMPEHLAFAHLAEDLQCNISSLF